MFNMIENSSYFQNKMFTNTNVKKIFAVYNEFIKTERNNNNIENKFDSIKIE